MGGVHDQRRTGRDYQLHGRRDALYSAAVADSKIYMQGGGWNQITTLLMPFAQSRIGLAMLIGVPYTATNRTHKIGVVLEDADGNEMPLGPRVPADDSPTGFKQAMMVGGMFNVGRTAQPSPGDRRMLPIAMNLDQVEFSAAGAYRFRIDLDGKEVSELTFRVSPCHSS